MRNGFAHFVWKVFARRKLLSGKFWVFAPLPQGHVKPFISGPARACPSPYSIKDGDVPGWGSIRDGRTDSVPDIATCATYCDKEPGCCSFEFSPARSICNLNKECQPTAKVFEDFDFCVKGNQTTVDKRHKTSIDNGKAVSGHLPHE